MSTYRVGNHQPRNLYRGDQYIGVCFDPADTALIVDAMEGRTPAEGPRAWECKLVREHNPETDPCDCRVSQFCAMGHSIDDAPVRPLSLPMSDFEASMVGRDANGGPSALESAYPVRRCGQSSAHGPHFMDHGPDQPRNCPGTGR